MDPEETREGAWFWNGEVQQVVRQKKAAHKAEDARSKRPIADGLGKVIERVQDHAYQESDLAADGNLDHSSASARPPKRGAQAKKAKTGKRNKKKKQKDTRQSNRKNGDRKNGNSKSFRPDTDNNTQNGTADNNESSQSVDIFSDLEDNDYPMEELEDNAADREEEVICEDNAAEREEDEETREDDMADREEEEVTRGDNVAEREEEEVTRGDNAADMEEEEVTRGDNVAEREEEEVTRGDNAADREQEEVTRRPPQSTENGTIDPPESNGNSELVASKANTNAENPPSTSSKSRKRKPASKPSTTNPKRKREVKVLPRPLSSKKKVPAVPKNVGNLESARSDAGSNGENHIASVNDSSSALSKSPPRKRAPMKELEANKTIEHKGQPIRPPTKLTENRACRNNKDGRKEQDTVMPLPPNAEGNGRNDLAQRSDNDNTSTREPAQKRRPRRKRKPWNPRPRKTPSVRNKANARPQSDSRRQYQSAQPEQNAVINKSAHEPVENPGHPRTQANAPPTMHMRKIEDEVIQRMYVFRQGETLMRVVESNGGRRGKP
ncbi:unnamed protein product [Haemonchus placei]|uniref:PHD-type domain-containing protein n=1 Tax=Haemonchus placei TaxID=6290 RepID=A0A0N4X8G9_HAEPC|nr:unnamed protein product [Haemonchus placei]